MFSTLRDVVETGEVFELRGDGKAGGGLMMAIQSFSKALGQIQGIEIQEWPQFSSARKGANMRVFMRIANHPIHTSAAIVRPHASILSDLATAESVDFASGVSNGIYIVNTPASARETAEQFRLCGRTIVVDGDALGEKHLGHRIGNISTFAALVQMSGYLTADQGERALDEIMTKRRLPDTVRQANLTCYRESVSQIESVTVEGKSDWDHPPLTFQRFPFMPMGAQSPLRTSLKNRTSRYRPSGFHLAFEDAAHNCSGCSLCITNCPENIIAFIPDDKRGVRVMGADVVDFCKLCRECVEVCPANLFSVKEEFAHEPAHS